MPGAYLQVVRAHVRQGPVAPSTAAPQLPPQVQTDVDKAQAELNSAWASRDRRKEADALIGLGDAWSSVSEFKKALNYYRQALQVARSVGDRKAAAAALRGMGSMYDSMSQKQTALRYYNQALAMGRAAEDRKGVAKTLRKIGSTLGDIGQKKPALADFSEALPIFHALHDRNGEADTLTNIGSIYQDLGEEQKALEYLSKAVGLYRPAQNLDGEGNALSIMAGVYDDMGQEQKALEYCDQALSLLRRAGDRDLEADTVGLVGTIYSNLDENQKALDYYQQALSLYHVLGDPDGEATAEQNIGNVYDGFGEKRKALAFYNQALPLFRAAEDRDGVATTLCNLASTYDDLGEKRRALDLYRESLSIRRDIGDRDGEATTLNQTGQIYSDLGEKQQALRLFQQALSLFTAVSDSDGQAAAMTGIGRVYDDLGQRQKALDRYHQALSIYRTVGDRDGEATALNDIAALYSEMDQREKGIRIYNTALVIYRAVGDTSGEANTLDNIGADYSYMGERQKMLDYYTQALPIAATIDEPLLEALIFHNLLRTERVAHPSLAIFYGKESVNLLQRVRGNMKGLSKELQKSFLAGKSSYYHELADLLIAQDRLPEAEQVLDMMKAAEFDDFVRGSKDSADQAGALTAKEQAAENAYQAASQHLFEIADAASALEKKEDPTPDDKAKLAELQQQLTDARRAFTSLMGALPRMLPDNGQGEKAEVMNDKIPELQDLMANIAQPGTVALYTMITNNYYRVIVIRNDGRTVERHSQIPVATLRQQVARFKELLSTRPGATAIDDAGNTRRTPAETVEMMDLAAKLYNVIMAPIAADLVDAHAHTLVWELDDVLHYIPLGALYDSAAKQFQMQQYANAITTPRDQQKKHEVPDLAGVRLLALGLSRSGYDQEFGSLPNVPNELAAIVRDPADSSTHGVLPGSEWLDLRFTEARLISELTGVATSPNSQPYKIVHIASHFNADPAGDYIKSFLLLAGQNAALDQKGQGFHLTLDDLKNEENLRLIFKNVDLLTLSACQTAVAVQNGDGREIDGLGGVAQEQGADAVMASLWSVDDQSTATLMEDFYKLWTDPAAKLSKAEALRKTQVKMIGGGNPGAQYSDPYYWAPFILMGNWK